MLTTDNRPLHRGPSADPLLRRVFPSWPHYRSNAQAWAAQMLRNAPPGGVVLAALATGGGKTLTYLLPLLEERERRGRAGALVVAPTISLAVDQADALSRRYPSSVGPIRATEAHSALGPAERAAREAAFVRGEYDVLLVSPERALNPEFIERVRGMGDALRFLVIDEAHTMCDWGETFRLEYPRLGWLRRGLLRSSVQLRTHLMSATVPRHTERQLKRLFAVDDRLWRTVRGSVLRFEAEIQVQALPFRGHGASVRWLSEHIKEMPAPALIYVTVPEHAEELGRALRSWGYRCGVYHGETPEDERQRISRQWAAGELDYIVGTSAFGLGIDKPNVRSVTHLCIPESLDRYYQELGRAGRDGGHCLANLVTVEEDINVAQNNAKQLLTQEKFAARWEALVNGGECLEDTGSEVYWLMDESNLPGYAAPRQWYGGDDPRDLHTRWNKSLLNFLGRLGLAAYEGPFPSEVSGIANDAALGLLRNQGWRLGQRSIPQVGGPLKAAYSSAPGPGWETQRHQMLQLIRTLGTPEVTWRSAFRVERAAIAQAPAALEEFQERVEARRNQELEASYRAISAMVKYARSQQTGCYRQPIAELYGERLDACGNCGWCITHGLRRGASSEPRKPEPWDSYEGPVSSRVRQLADSSGVALVCHGGALGPGLFRRLERAGFRQYLVPASDAPASGTVHLVEEFRPELTVMERMPTVVSLPAGMDKLSVRRLLSYLDAQQGRFSAAFPCLILLHDDVLWEGREAYLGKFPGRVINLEELEARLPPEV